MKKTQREFYGKVEMLQRLELQQVVDKMQPAEALSHLDLIHTVREVTMSSRRLSQKAKQATLDVLAEQEMRLLPRTI
jgi:hypothetical protein